MSRFRKKVFSYWKWRRPRPNKDVKLTPAAHASGYPAAFGRRDGQIKGVTQSYVVVFYDITPNIRLGFEWGIHGTNRRRSSQDNQSHRWQFGGYFFF